MATTLVPFNATATADLITNSFNIISDLKYYFIAIFSVFFILFILDIIIPLLTHKKQ